MSVSIGLVVSPVSSSLGVFVPGWNTNTCDATTYKSEVAVPKFDSRWRQCSRNSIEHHHRCRKLRARSNIGALASRILHNTAALDIELVVIQRVLEPVGVSINQLLQLIRSGSPAHPGVTPRGRCVLKRDAITRVTETLRAPLSPPALHMRRGWCAAPRHTCGRCGAAAARCCVFYGRVFCCSSAGCVPALLSAPVPCLLAAARSRQ